MSRHRKDDLAIGAGGVSGVAIVMYVSRRLGYELQPEQAATVAGAAAVVGVWLRRRFTDTPGEHAVDHRREDVR